MFHIPVTLPYTLSGDAADQLHSLAIDAVAATPSEAVAQAVIVAAQFARMRHPGRTAQLQLTRVITGAVGVPITGLYAYVLTSRFTVSHCAFPAQIDRDGALQFLSTLNALETRNLYGVIADCGLMTHLGPEGLAAIGAIAPKVRLRLVRPSADIQHLLTTSTVSKVAPSFPNLASALADLASNWMQIAATNVV